MALPKAGVEFVYEKPLTLGGETRYPDFTIEDEISGRSIYWEHLGMLGHEGYEKSWKRKLEWYKKNKVLPESEGSGNNGMLVESKGSGVTGFDLTTINATIKRLFAG